MLECILREKCCRICVSASQLYMPSRRKAVARKLLTTQDRKEIRRLRKERSKLRRVLSFGIESPAVLPDHGPSIRFATPQK